MNSIKLNVDRKSTKEGARKIKWIFERVDGINQAGRNWFGPADQLTDSLIQGGDKIPDELVSTYATYSKRTRTTMDIPQHQNEISRPFAISRNFQQKQMRHFLTPVNAR